MNDKPEGVIDLQEFARLRQEKHYQRMQDRLDAEEPEGDEYTLMGGAFVDAIHGGIDPFEVCEMWFQCANRAEFERKVWAKLDVQRAAT
jgi:hypothetical protein